MTLVEFLLARIAEDEAAVVVPTGPRRNGKTFARRRLAECQAKRSIVEEWERLEVDAREFADPEAMVDEIHTGLVWAYLDVLRHLAAVYADHPDYAAARWPVPPHAGGPNGTRE